MVDEAPELRPLGRVERLVWFIDRAASVNFTMIAELDGPLDAATLDGALAAVQARHPLLRARIVRDGARLSFCTWVGPPPPIAVRRVDAPADAWVAEGEREIATPFAWDREPLVRCVWLRHGEAHHTLLLTFCHVIGDGISGAYLLRDLVQACAAAVGGVPVALPPLALPTPLEAHLPAAARGGRGAWLLARELGRMAGRQLRPGARPARLRHDAEAPRRARRAHVHPLVLEPAATQALQGRARAAGTTLHGALGAALARALRGELEPAQERPVIHLGSPVNMRRRMVPPVGEDVGLYVSLADAVARDGPDVPFWALARALRDDTAAAIARGAPLAMVAASSRVATWARLFPPDERGVDRMARSVIEGAMAHTTTGLSNVGALALAVPAGPLSVRAAHFVVSLSVIGSLVATAASHNDRLHVNLIAMAPLVERPRAAAIAARMAAELAAQTDTPGPAARG